MTRNQALRIEIDRGNALPWFSKMSGEQLATWRRSLGMRPRHFAAICMVDVATVQAWESSACVPLIAGYAMGHAESIWAASSRFLESAAS